MSNHPPEPMSAPAPTLSLHTQQPPRSLLGKLLNLMPTLATFGLLVAVGWFGQAHGWKMPKASVLAGATIEAKKENWCSEHNAPEDSCVECKKDLLPACIKPRWCKQHGVSECPTCHPELAQVTGPVKLPQYDTIAAINQFDRPENNSRCQKFLRRIQYESVEAFQKMGIAVAVATERPMIEALRINGELDYDQSRLAHLSTRVPGNVWKVFKALGDEVQAGDVLALVDAAEVGKAKNNLSRVIVQLQLRKKSLEALRAAGGAVAERQIREAETAYEEAQLAVVMNQQALVNLGFELPGGLLNLDARQLTRALQCLSLPSELCETLLTRGGMTMNLIPIIAPQNGMIVELDVVAGEVVHPEKSLLTVADLRRMWLTLNVKQEDVERIAVGQPVTFRPDGSPDVFDRKVAFISPSVDERTRTVNVRAVLPNPNGRLKSNSFGTGSIVLRSESRAVTVPLAALQWEGDCNVVFVRDKNFEKPGSPKVFHVRQVRPGAKDDTHIELLAGVLPGEIVAAHGSAALRGELLKNNLGAG